jgi:hypothetical protein
MGEPGDARMEGSPEDFGTAGAPLTATFGRDAADRLAQAETTGLAGAVAALETFYHAFNRRDADLLARVWADAPWVRLNNPVGGILQGPGPVADLYRAIFAGPARVWVEFHDVVAYVGADMAVFAGRERGAFRTGETELPLAIRTTRVFAFAPWRPDAPARWAQVHHHGSIDDPDLLARYQRAVRGGTP